MNKQAAGATSSPNQEMSYLDKMLMLDRKDREGGGQLSEDDVATLTRFRAHLRGTDSVMFYDDELGRYCTRDRREGEDAVFVGATPSTALPAKPPTMDKQRKLWPWVTGGVLLMFASTRVAGWERQWYMHSVLEARQTGRLSVYEEVAPFEPHLAYDVMWVGLTIVAVCTVIWMVRKIKTRKNRTADNAFQN